jgi:hypothetical protein
MICHLVGTVVGHITDRDACGSGRRQVNVIDANACTHDTTHASLSQSGECSVAASKNISYQVIKTGAGRSVMTRSKSSGVGG